MNIIFFMLYIIMLWCLHLHWIKYPGI